jgi:hypothetical protein
MKKMFFSKKKEPDFRQSMPVIGQPKVHIPQQQQPQPVFKQPEPQKPMFSEADIQRIISESRQSVQQQVPAPQQQTTMGFSEMQRIQPQQQYVYQGGRQIPQINIPFEEELLEKEKEIEEPIEAPTTTITISGSQTYVNDMLKKLAR